MAGDATRRTFAAGIRGPLERLAEVARDYTSSALSDNSRRAYTAD